MINNGTFLDHETTPEYSLLLTAQDNPQALSSEVRQRSSVPVGFYINSFTKHYISYTTYWEIFASVLFSPLLPSLSLGEFKTGRVTMFQIISLKIQLCSGEFKMGQNCSQVGKGENYTGQK